MLPPASSDRTISGFCDQTGFRTTATAQARIIAWPVARRPAANSDFMQAEKGARVGLARLRAPSDGYDPGDLSAGFNRIAGDPARQCRHLPLAPGVDDLGAEASSRARAPASRRPLSTNTFDAKVASFLWANILPAATASHGLRRDCDRSMSPGPLQLKLSLT
jgi:hypothetical protein